MRLRHGLSALMLGLVSLAHAGPKLLTYQGSLLDSVGRPVPDGAYEMRFTIYDDSTTGTQRWTETEHVQVKGGFYSVVLGDATAFGNLFNWFYSLWLEVEVDLDGDGFEAGEKYAPRRRMASAAWAMDSDLLQGHSSSYFQRRVTGTATAGEFIRAVNADGTVVTGADQDTRDWPSISDKPNTFPPDPHTHTGFWSLNGNAIPLVGTASFLGTTNDVALNLKVNNETALRLQPNTTSPNVIGGYQGNVVAPGFYGATIGGGGRNGNVNSVTGNFGTVGGGERNTVSRAGAFIGGGQYNIASGVYTAIGGGQGNEASADGAALGGGFKNRATADNTTVGGGIGNFARGIRATVGGGAFNRAEGTYATVPGGLQNSAAGHYSFAAGRQAQANHDGAFVWADSNGADFASTTTDQFAIRAGNGVYLAADAGSTKSVAVGERYRDNAVIAWAKVVAAGTFGTDAYGVASVLHPFPGRYDVSLTAQAATAGTLIPMAVAEIDSQPFSAAAVRIVSINQTGQRTFEVYINDGAFVPVDNDFVFMVTGR